MENTFVWGGPLGELIPKSEKHSRENNLFKAGQTVLSFLYNTVGKTKSLCTKPVSIPGERNTWIIITNLRGWRVGRTNLSL